MRKCSFFSMLFVVLFFAVAGTQKAYCQVQKQINQSTLTRTTYAIPSFINESELSALDWVYLEIDEDLEECKEYIIKGDTLTIVRYDPKLPRWERDYQYELGKSVTSVWGTALYYHDGTEYFRLEEYSPEFILSPEEIENYRDYTAMFDMDKATLISIYQTQGFQVREQDGFVIVAYEGMFELSINLDELIHEMRFFSEENNPFFGEENNTLEDLTRTEFTRTANGYVVPVKEIRIRYSELPSGIPYEITDTISYLFYQIIKNGTTLAKTGNESMFEDCRNSVADPTTQVKEIQQYTNIKIYPNPAKEQITVDFSANGEGIMDVKIFNMLGVNVLSQQYNKGGQININVASLPAGVYVVRCVQNDKVTSTRLIKQ